MRYAMQAKLFSLKNDFTINDANGNPAYVIKAKLISMTDNLRIQDTQGNEVAAIKGKLGSMTKAHEITRNGTVAAVLKQTMLSAMLAGPAPFLFSKNFYLELTDGSRIEISGNYSDYSYTFKKGDEVIAEASRKWFSFKDSFGVDIADGQDDVLILAATVAIDLIVKRER